MIKRMWLKGIQIKLQEIICPFKNKTKQKLHLILIFAQWQQCISVGGCTFYSLFKTTLLTSVHCSCCILDIVPRFCCVTCISGSKVTVYV